jgi:hypothetical protein
LHGASKAESLSDAHVIAESGLPQISQMVADFFWEEQ